MDYFKLIRTWFDFAFENPEKIKPNHIALYTFCVEHCNRLGWKSKFGLPIEMAKDAIGIRSYNTFINTLNDLIEFGFIILIEKSRNQYSSNIIALSNFDKALDKALDKASIKHVTKQGESTVQSIDSIIKHITNIPINKYTSKQVNIILNYFNKKNRKFTPPILDDVKQYFKENGYKEDTAIKMFKSYSINDWKDSNDKPVKNWKQKAINVWFKDENKISVNVNKFQY